MTDGYYLSLYIEINALANLYKYSNRHDQSIALWKKSGKQVELIHYWELERQSGKKEHRVAFYDVVSAKNTINKLLKTYDLSLDQMKEVWGEPELQTVDDYHSLIDLPEYSYHGIAHLFSAVMMDTNKFYNDNILGLGIDGGPDTVIDHAALSKSFYAGSISHKGKLEYFPAYSHGVFWAMAETHFHLRAGTLMALASASNSKLFYDIDEVLLYNNNLDGNLLKIHDFLENIYGVVEKLTIEDQGELFNEFDSRFTEEENKISMVMKIINEMSLKIMDYNIDTAIQKYNIIPEETYLALGGGSILNCPTNSYLMHKYKFKGFMAPPCVSDTGMSLGIGLYAFFKKMGKFDFKFRTAFYGDRDESLDEILATGTYKNYVKQVSDFDVNKAVEDLKAGSIVWFNGAAEVGPRALGNRSILADPRDPKIKDELNRIKERQWWRPVAPIVLEDEAENWFEETYPSPYMLHTFIIRDEKKALIPAVAHIDESSRVQTVREDENKDIYQLIKAFMKDTGVPIICNTSLNDKGEPIINRIEEALNFCLRKAINIMYVNGRRIELQKQEEFEEKSYMKRSLSDIIKTEEEREQLKAKLNPHGLADDIIYYYLDNIGLQSIYNLQDKRSIRELKLYYKSKVNVVGFTNEIWR